MPSRIAKVTVAAALLVSSVAAWSAPAAAVSVGCGSTVTGPVTLSHDLHCHGDGVTLLSGRLDLHGHTISGDGTGSGVIVGDQSDAFPAVNASVVNGRVTGFAIGITSPGNDQLTLQLGNLTVAHSTMTGIEGTFISSTVLDHVTVRDSGGNAIIVTSPNKVAVGHSTISHNRVGVAVVADGRADIVSTTIDSNTTAIDCSQGLVTVARSRVSHNDSGVQLFECEGSSLTGSAFVDNVRAASEETVGFTDTANPTLTVAGDIFRGNEVGLHLTTLAMAVVVRDSMFLRNGTGIVMDACSPADAPCVVPINDEFVGNHFVQNRGNGVTWGFGTLRVARNHFIGNGGWGFFAAAGTTIIDGGGNVAHANRVGNCHGLRCS